MRVVHNHETTSEDMKQKILRISLVIILLLLTLMTIRTCKLDKLNRELVKELDTSKDELRFLQDHPVHTTDTVFKENITPPKPKSFELNPSKVIHPKNSSLGDSNPSSSASEEALTGAAGLSLRDSLVGVDLNKNKFTFTFQNPNYGYHTAEFQIKPTEYQYVWVDGKLTAEKLHLYKRLEIKPFVSLSFRPIHKLWDLNLGIAFKTKSLNYNLGINTFYYPRWQSKPGIDALVQITYNF